MMFWNTSETVLRQCVEERLEFRSVRSGIFCSRLCIFEVVGSSKDGGRLRALAKRPEDFRRGRGVRDCGRENLAWRPVSNRQMGAAVSIERSLPAWF